MISTDKLKNKEVINIGDGKSLGFVCDIEVDLDKGVIDGIVIPAGKGFLGFFAKKEGDMVVKWDKVRTVGDDVILVDLGPFSS